MADDYLIESIEASLGDTLASAVGGGIDPISFMFRVVRFITDESDSHPSQLEIRRHYETICRRNSLTIVPRHQQGGIIDEVIDEVL